MKRLFLFRNAFVLTILAALALILPNRAEVQEGALKNIDLKPGTGWDKMAKVNMESSLYRIWEMNRLYGKDKAQEYAIQRGISMEGDLIRIVAVTKRTGVSAESQREFPLLTSRLASLGGKPEATARGLIQALVPISSLTDISLWPEVKFLRLPLKPVRCAITSEGVNRTGATGWQSATSYRGQSEVRVGILDIGFDGYQQLLGNELPSQVVTRSFRADGDISAGEKHGTACAEIVHDMAPEAKLYLVNFSNDVEHYNAVNWLISRNVDAISYSLGWTNAGAGDGTGPICDDVRRAANNEIAWASAAGNEAVAHWEGNFNDTDGDGWHNFSSNDEILDFWVPGSTPVAADLNWDDWGTWDGNNYSGSREDYDLYLYRLSGSDWVQVDSSTNWQTGTEWPVESIGYWEIPSATYWGIAIRKSNATRNVKLEVFIEGNAEAIEYNIPAGSIIIPADSSSAIACGATDWSNDSYHYYSSRGPTSDLRIKPDFTAPSGVSTQTYGMRSFYGTSASAPHMAGAIALLKGKTPYSLSQILTILQFRAVDLGTPGKDNQFGRGRLDLRK